MPCLPEENGGNEKIFDFGCNEYVRNEIINMFVECIREYFVKDLKLPRFPDYPGDNWKPACFQGVCEGFAYKFPQYCFFLYLPENPDDFFAIYSPLENIEFFNKS